MEPKKPNDPEELGGWRINGRLGEGGFGTVFLAEKGAQKAAIKVIKQEFVEEADSKIRLAVEAEVLSKLSDPAIGKILDSDLTGKLPWIATEFINGPTLEDKVKYEGPLEEVAWFNLAENLFHAIVSANELGIIHKDIKPSNIILGETGNKLIDFGIAHISGQTRTVTFGDREGSTPFSSPEHFTIRTNPKMDVFSAAATLAFAAKGAWIWNGENDLQLMRSINEDSPNFDGLSENQIKFLAPLLEKNPSDRPSAFDAHQSSLDYIEFLLGKSRRPTKLKGRSIFKKLIRSKTAISGITLALFVSAAFAASVQNQKNGQEIKNINPPATSSSTDFPSPSASLSKDSKSGDSKTSSTECQRLTNEFKTNEAIKICTVAAQSGDAVAMNALGYNYFVTLKDEAKGIDWYQKAAKAGSAVAMFNLGTLYLEKKDTIEAEKWFKQCVDSDYAFCAFNYGSLLEKSKRIPEAKVAYQQGIKLGDSGSAQNLGLIYINEQNWSKAKEVLLIGANLDNYLSAYSLGQVYANNYSDLENACNWFYKSISLKKDYLPALKAVIEICKNRKYELAPDVIITKTADAPYQAIQNSTDHKAGDWVLWLKNANFDASSATGVQFRVSGTNDRWQYVFYSTYSNAAGIYSYINERAGLEGNCLDFRLVKESKDGYIVQIWEMPKSICKK
jgi:serine/threonine protein kinase